MAASKGELSDVTWAKLDAVPEPGPMIARTVSLTILVKTLRTPAAALDAILDDNQAYAAQLNLTHAGRRLAVLPGFAADSRNPTRRGARFIAEAWTGGD